MLSHDIKNLSARAESWRYGVIFLPEFSTALAVQLYDFVQRAETLERATPPYGLARSNDDETSVSGPLEALRGSFAQYADESVEFSAEAIAIFQGTLTEAANLAAELEALPPLNEAANQGFADVVDLSNWRNHQGRIVGHVVMPAPDYEGEIGADEPRDPGAVA